MNIIFGDQEFSLNDGYIVLELDQFRMPDDSTARAWAVVGNLPVHEFPTLEHFRTLHSDMIRGFRNQHWDYVQEAVGQLMGRWNHELDTFYQSILDRVGAYRAAPPPPDWDGSFGSTDYTANN